MLNSSVKKKKNWKYTVYDIQHTGNEYFCYCIIQLHVMYMYLLQSSSIDFLASQGFDFNKVFKEGKSFVLIVTNTTLTCKKLKQLQMR